MAGKDSLREETQTVGDDQLVLLTAGAGKPLLVLHEELGWPGWLRWMQEFSAKRTLLIPLHPGFGRTPRADWIMNVRDLACFYARFLRAQQLAPIDVIGFSFGGWIAAEMAANDPALFSRMVLVAPAGIRPPEGEITDLFTITAMSYLRRSVLDERTPEFALLFGGGQSPEQYEALEDARAETARLAWQPYLYNPSLPRLLEGAASVRTMIVWGRDDRIVPFAAASIYQHSLTGAKLVTFEHCGHRPEIEKSDQFIRELDNFLQ
jgi:pimeloyl-ACP methyl ester carboxylesterase